MIGNMQVRNTRRMLQSLWEILTPAEVKKLPLQDCINLKRQTSPDYLLADRYQDFKGLKKTGKIDRKGGKFLSRYIRCMNF